MVKKILEQSRLYGILDLGYAGDRDPLWIASQMIEGGVRIIQLRAKGKKAPEVLSLGRDLVDLCRSNQVVLIINDFPEVARECRADGVHVGQEDGSIGEIRSMLNPGQIVGRSTHGLDQAIAAEQEGADYIGIGPIFPTSTKPDYIPVGLPLIRQVYGKVGLPGFCIGGIKRENLDQVIQAGAKQIVIVSGILQADDIVAYCKEVIQKMG